MITVTVATDDADGLDERERAELAQLLVDAVEAPDDEHAWRPMVRARRLLERARIVARRAQS
jgi:hypothetical protein